MFLITCSGQEVAITVYVSNVWIDYCVGEDMATFCEILKWVTSEPHGNTFWGYQLETLFTLIVIVFLVFTGQYFNSRLISTGLLYGYCFNTLDEYDEFFLR